MKTSKLADIALSTVFVRNVITIQFSGKTGYGYSTLYRRQCWK